jgi:uncharacterized protein YdeI (YjbR/CyaY-like superfamily)
MTTQNPDIDALLRRTKTWQAETRALRSMLLEAGLTEELKWGKPCYGFQGANVAIIQGFKASCALMFFKGALLQDTHRVLAAPGANSQAARRLEFTSVAQVKAAAPIIRDYVAQAVELERSGRRVAFTEKHELELPVELTAAFKAQPKLGKAFRALTPGRQRAYVLHFAGAKQSATRVARIEKCAPAILAGRGLNDR